MEIVTSEPLFNSAHSALVFAFNFSCQCYDRPMMNRLASPAVGSGKGLAGLDGAAQAGMIRAEVQALGKLAEAIMLARLAPRTTPCSCRSSCCSGHKPNREWINAIGVLADHVRTSALAGCTSNGLIRREYVVRYFTLKDQRVSLERLAEQHGIDRHTVGAHYSKTAKSFKDAESLAQNAIEDRLREIGMVGAD